MTRTAALALFILCLLAGNSVAEVYKWKDASGKVHYTDNPKENPEAEKITLQINSYESVKISEIGRTPENAPPGNSKHVMIYTTTRCGYCNKAKQYFRDNKIPYTDYNIEKDPAAKRKYDQLRGRGVPIILVGQKRMDGFSVEAFKRFYN